MKTVVIPGVYRGEITNREISAENQARADRLEEFSRELGVLLDSVNIAMWAEYSPGLDWIRRRLVAQKIDVLERRYNLGRLKTMFSNSDECKRG